VHGVLLRLTGSIFFRDLLGLPQPIEVHDSSDEEGSTEVDRVFRKDKKNKESPEGHRHGKRKRQDCQDSEVFDLDVHSNGLAMFLDLVNFGQLGRSTHRAVSLPLADIRQLLPLVEKFDCPDIRAMFHQCLVALAPKDPWAILSVASIHNDIVLAKVAIGHLTLKHIAPRLKWPTYKVTRIAI
jgi:hypothetical protein